MPKPDMPTWDELFPFDGKHFHALPEDTIFFLPPGFLEATVDQPRTEWDEGDVPEMAESIKERRNQKPARGVGGTGVLQPITIRYPPGVINNNGHIKTYRDDKGNLRPVPFKFLITMGETRWRGSLLAESPVVPVIIKDQSREDAYEDALIENIQRNNLKPLDEARATRHIMNTRGLSFRAAAKRLNKDVGWVQNRLDLLGVAEDMQQLVTARPDSMVAAIRMNKVKHPELRAVLIQLVLDRVPYNVIQHLIPFDKVKDEEVLLDLIELLKNNDTDAARVQFAKYIALHTNDVGSEESSKTVGSARPKGTATMASLNIEDTLSAIHRQAESLRSAVRGVSLPRRQYREKIIPRVEEIEAILLDIRAAGASQERRYDKSKGGKKTGNK